MRENKFRAWNKKERRLYSPFLLDDIGTDEFGLYIICEKDYMRGSWEDYIIMQYTGLKDKNGKEIYEGDVIKYREYPNNEKSELCKIEWLDSYEGDGFKMTGFVSPAYDYPTDIEIIGNIHENPELLEHEAE